MSHPREGGCVIREGMKDIAIAGKMPGSCMFLVHAKNAEEQVDNDRNKFEDIDVNFIIYQQRIYALKIRRYHEDLLRIHSCGKSPLEIKEEAVASKTPETCIRIDDKGWITWD